MTKTGVIIINSYRIALLICVCIAWGVITKAIIKSKGYDENWFWWGFFFWFFAAIVAARREKLPYQKLCSKDKNNAESGLYLSGSAEVDLDKLKGIQWQCGMCGTVNAIHIQSCKCGIGIGNKKNIFLEK